MNKALQFTSYRVDLEGSLNMLQSNSIYPMKTSLQTGCCLMMKVLLNTDVLLMFYIEFIQCACPNLENISFIQFLLLMTSVNAIVDPSKLLTF